MDLLKKKERRLVYIILAFINVMVLVVIAMVTPIMMLAPPELRGNTSFYVTFLIFLLFADLIVIVALNKGRMPKSTVLPKHKKSEPEPLFGKRE